MYIDVPCGDDSDGQVLVAGDRLELVGAQVARDVDVALLQQQQLRRRDRRRGASRSRRMHRLLRRMRIGVDDHVVARRPLGQLVRSGAGGVASSARRCRDRRWSGSPSPSSCPPRCRHWPTGSTARSWSPAPRSAASSPACSRPAARIIFSTLSALKPNWVMMKPGVLLSLTTRCRLNAASFAVTGLPESNFASRCSLKVKVRPSGLTVQLLGEVAVDLGGVVHVGPDQPAVAVGIDLVVGELIGFRRIEADDVVDLPGHHGDALRRGGVRPGQDGGRGDGWRPSRPAGCVWSAW